MYDTSPFFSAVVLFSIMISIILITGGCTQLTEMFNDEKVVKNYCLNSETYQLITDAGLWDKTKKQLETKYPQLKELPFTIEIADSSKESDCSNGELEDLVVELKDLKDLFEEEK